MESRSGNQLDELIEILNDKCWILNFIQHSKLNIHKLKKWKH